MAKHTHPMYGHFPGGDPRRFKPDGEDSNTPDEIAAHKVACAEWDAWESKGSILDDRPDVRGACRPLGEFGHLTVTMYGLGIYEYDCDDDDCADDGPEDDWSQEPPTPPATRPRLP